LTQAAAALQRRVISSEELTKLCLARIQKFDPALNSFITVTADTALAQARLCAQQRFADSVHYPWSCHATHHYCVCWIEK
jgi:aspartyl-tRNA(Asn)/glutamyl-tRNA(Gln) amidotransferase subunit A